MVFKRVVNSRFHLLCIIVLFVSSSILRAGSETGNELTLQEALRLADEQNLLLNSARHEREVAKGQVMQARSIVYPHLNLSGRYVRLDELVKMGSGENVTTIGQLDNYDVLAEVTQVIYAGGGVRAALKLAHEYADGVDAQVETARQKTAFAVHATFNQVLLAKEQLAVAREAVEFAEKTLHDVNALLRQGIATNFDKLRAESRVSQSKAECIAAENACHLTKLALLNMLNLPLDDPREIVGTLHYQPVQPDALEAVAIALENRPDLDAAKRFHAAQEQAVKIMRSGYMPNLAAFGQYKYVNPDRFYQAEWESSWLVGLRIGLSLFDGNETRGKVMQEKARARQSALQLENLFAQVRLEVAKAEADMISSGNLVDAFVKNVVEAEEALRLVQRAYEQGVQAQIDVITAQVALTDARRRYATAVYQHTMARRGWELAMGILSFQQPVEQPVELPVEPKRDGIESQGE